MCSRRTNIQNTDIKCSTYKALNTLQHIDWWTQNKKYDYNGHITIK